jgi:hypothetical protein
MEDFVTRCGRKFGKSTKCAQIADVNVFAADGNPLGCRCNEHFKSDFSRRPGITTTQIVHDWNKVLGILEPLVGKVVVSKWHDRVLRIKFLKKENMTLMCQDARYDGTGKNKSHAKWFALYSKEITEVLPVLTEA